MDEVDVLLYGASAFFIIFAYYMVNRKPRTPDEILAEVGIVFVFGIGLVFALFWKFSAGVFWVILWLSVWYSTLPKKGGSG